MTQHLVWLKRDLRLADNEALFSGTREGPCVILFIIEPELLKSDDFDPSHYQFIRESLVAVRQQLRAYDAQLTIRTGESVQVLNQIFSKYRFDVLHSHQETGNQKTYRRDLRVKKWTKTHNVKWEEYRQHGVMRRLPQRDGWAKQWTKLMDSPVFPIPDVIQTIRDIDPGQIPSLMDLGMRNSQRTSPQKGGEKVAQQMLTSFLQTRGERYQKEMSSPRTAQYACSRLSAHLSYGNISMRTLYQSTEKRRFELREKKTRKEEIGGNWLSSLASFSKRLRWHCHFMQKLEDQPEIEFENMARVYDGLREPYFNSHFFESWCRGQTGYPMVDACMRCLAQTGWINFRMRAMLISFASYHLWLHWRPTALFLAKKFIDYEAGIHFAQCQMQSGTTGINAIRIYSPIKQVHDHDPAGEFIRQWVPELAGVSSKLIAQPELMTKIEQIQSGCIIEQDYPRPLVEHKDAVSQARSKIYQIRNRKGSREEAQRIYVKHGSRKRPQKRRSKATEKTKQQSLKL